MKTYHDRFIEAVMLLQAKMNIQSQKDMAAELGIAYMTLYKIMDKTNRPTVEHCTTVLLRGGYDANWLFLGKSGKYAAENASLNRIYGAIKQLEAAVSG